ncbi:MAG: hypothetical protein Kow0074_02720 [Candidatus Zixiibacteriota bacterium]
MAIKVGRDLVCDVRGLQEMIGNDKGTFYIILNTNLLRPQMVDFVTLKADPPTGSGLVITGISILRARLRALEEQTP